MSNNFIYSLHTALQKNTYLSLQGNDATVTKDKDKRASLADIIKHVESINQNDRLTIKELKDLQSAFRVVTNRVEAKRAPWYLRIPIIACIFQACKQIVLKRAKVVDDQLSRRIEVRQQRLNPRLDQRDALANLASVPFSGYGFCTWQAGDKIGFVQKRPLEEVSSGNVTYFNQDDDIEKKIGEADSLLKAYDYFANKKTVSGRALKVGVYSPSLHLSVQLPGNVWVDRSFSNRFYEGISQFFTTINEDPLQLLYDTGIYKPRTTEDILDICYRPVGTYRIYDDPKSPNSLYMASVHPSLFMPVVKRHKLFKDRNLFSQIEQILRTEPTHAPGAHSVPQSAPQSVPQTPEQALKDAKKKFLEVLNPDQNASVTSFEKVLELRKKWLRTNHTDRAGYQERTAKVNDAWNLFVAEIQRLYKKEDVNITIMKELDQKYPIK